MGLVILANQVFHETYVNVVYTLMDLLTETEVFHERFQ